MNITLEQLDHLRSTVGRYAELRLLPVETHNGTEYAIEHRTTTSDGYERLDAYDLTSYDSISREGSRAARFDANGQPDEQGDHVMVVWPNEGHASLVTRDGRGDRWCGTWAVALSASQKLKDDIMDEIESRVDAGGPLGMW